MKFADVTGV